MTSYYPNEVFAEIGVAPLGGAAVGALLFLLDPLVGLAGMIIGAALGGAAEQQRVDAFNNSLP